jgi:hypothetical protein
MQHLFAAIVGATVLCGTAFAAPSLDRSSLSVDENVMINTICGAARAQGASAYDTCVAQQLQALKTHPSPDRSALSAARSKAIASACDYVRRVGIGEYNSCLTKVMASTAAR